VGGRRARISRRAIPLRARHTLSRSRRRVGAALPNANPPRPCGRAAPHHAAPLAQIAARTGYGTPFSFGKAFKLSFGIAPGTYRSQANGRPNLKLAGSRRHEKTS
jgi:AraC-like DNA-binding protein